MTYDVKNPLITNEEFGQFSLWLGNQIDNNQDFKRDLAGPTKAAQAASAVLNYLEPRIVTALAKRQGTEQKQQPELPGIS